MAYTQKEVDEMMRQANGGMRFRNSSEMYLALKALREKANDIEALAEREKRALNAKESALLAEIDREILAIQDEANRSAEKPSTLRSWRGNPRGAEGAHSAYELRAPGQSKTYRDLFGSDGYQWPDKETNFFAAAFSGRHHPGLQVRAMNETVPSDGGFLVPVEYAERIHNVSLEDEIVQPRAFVQPMRSNEIKIPGMAIGSHASALMGGFTASYVEEAGQINVANPKTRSMLLSAKKLTGLLRFTSELTQDAPGGESQIISFCGKGLSWYRDRAFLKGSGAGEPLGILNSPCVVEVEPETGQNSGTIFYENLTKMMSSLYAGSFKNSVWVFHQTLIPQLLTLGVTVGLGGDHVPVMSESSGTFRILTRPVVFTEKTEPLGVRGDAMLCDFSQYVIGLRSEMRFDVSIHVHFQTDELLARLIERHDGQPLWNEPLTLEDGITKVSPFVVLGARN